MCVRGNRGFTDHLLLSSVVGWAAVLLPLASLYAQPRSGDVFCEYHWTNAEGDAGGALRVGGRVGYGGGPVALPHDVDLEHATRAEVVIEKLLCHAGTRGLEISLNGGKWTAVPESRGIPEPQWNYQHHTYPVVPIALSQLREGKQNAFRMRVDDRHPWDWPQHLIYGVHLRVYYDPALKSHVRGRLAAPRTGGALGREVPLRVEILDSPAEARRVDFIGRYEGVNLEGDGKYRQWHYHYVRGELTGHLGSATRPPWALVWDTSWIPDQPRPMQLAAWITDGQGVTFQTPVVGGLTWARQGLHVELCKPLDVPEEWVTRSGEHVQQFRVRGDLDDAVAARLVWCSWSPGYMEGVYVNGQQVLWREGPRYAYFVHQVPLEDLSVLRRGENTLKTGKTPKYEGKMVHGMEVNWPGIMVLIQYQQ